jgi:hypothetical protein
MVGLLGHFALAADKPEWSVNMTNIEACSCPMFCQCYFTGRPALHSDDDMGHAMSYCRFNNAFKINHGNWGATSLNDIKFWMSGDLGGDFSKPPLWIVLTFEPATTAEQRDGIRAIIGHIFMIDPKIIATAADAKIDWTVADDSASAKLDDGKAAEIELKKADGMDNNQQVVIKNLKFWAAPRNDGFKMMPNQLEAYRLGDKPFEYKDSNGFVVTIEMDSKDVAK